MTRQLKVDGEREYLKSVIARAVLVAEGVKTVTDHANGWFTMIIVGQTVPDEWATTAFALSARRHDYGNGHGAYMAWVFPVTVAPKINAKFPILNAWIKSHSTVLSYNTVQSRKPRTSPAPSSIQSSEMYFA